MKAAFLLAVAVLAPLAAVAQDAIPEGLAAVELERSRACVGSLARLEAMDQALAPYAARMERLRAMGRAVSLEDVGEAGTLDPAQPMEKAVADWFVADSVLAARWVAERDDAIQEERAAARSAILDQIRQAMQTVGGEAQEQLGDAAEVEAAARPCQGAILVRSAVVEACSGVNSSLCEAAAATEPQNRYRFVDAPADLWDVSDYRPWSQPEPLAATPQGALIGGRTAARARRGNAVFTLALTPLIRNRAELSEEEAAEFDTNLDSLGFTFEHPLFVFAPAFEIQANVPPPIGGETHILIHFADLTGDDVIWSAEVGEGGVIQAVFPATSNNLARLQQGEVVSLTAVKVDDVESGEAEPVYTVPVLTVNQAQFVNALIAYMGGGGLSEDLARLVPPSQGTGSPGR